MPRTQRAGIARSGPALCVRGITGCFALLPEARTSRKGRSAQAGEGTEWNGQRAAGLTGVLAVENALNREYSAGISPTPLIGAPRLWRVGLRWNSK